MSVLVLGIAIGLTVFALLLSLNWPLIAAAHATGDEFSLYAESSTPTLLWVTSGYSKYFMPYPEFWEPFTNFIRPVTNLFFFVYSCSGMLPMATCDRELRCGSGVGVCAVCALETHR